MSAEAYYAGVVSAAYFIAERFGRLMAMPEDYRPTEWLNIYAEARQAGINPPACNWPASYDEEFCLNALSEIAWLKADRLPPWMASELDDAEDDIRDRARTVAEFVITHLRPILPRPDALEVWRALAGRSGLFPPDLFDEPASLFTILAQAILVERHLRGARAVH